MALVAWKVADSHEGTGDVVFAHTEQHALRLAEQLTICAERAERAPEFDQYASEGRVAPAVLMANGWWLRCLDCQHEISDDGCDVCAGEDPDGLVPALVVEFADDVFCSTACRDSYRESQQAYRDTLRENTVRVERTWPGAFEIRAHLYGATFKFPGCRPQEEATVTWDDRGEFLTVSKPALAAWYEFASRHRVARSFAA